MLPAVRSIVIFLLVATTLSGCAPPGELDNAEVGQAAGAIGTAPYDVYLIEGQSNGVGTARTTELPADLAGLATAYKPVLFAEEIECPRDGSTGPCGLTESWHTLRPRAGGLFGLELSAGRRMDERSDRPIAILKHATSSSSLAVNWDSTGPGRTLWNYSRDFIDAQMALLPPGSRIAGLFWIQGNADGKNDLRYAEDYAENLGWFVMRLRQEYGCVPVVIDHLSPLVPPSAVIYRDVIRSEQVEAATYLEDLAMAETDNLTMRDGIQHYDARSTAALGERDADLMGLCP